jgi:hypothetical protein
MWFRKRKLEDNRSTRTVTIRGLVFSDLSSIPIRTDQFTESSAWIQGYSYSIYVNFSLRDSPILPTNETSMLKPEPNGQPKDLCSIIRSLFSIFSSSHNNKILGNEEEKDDNEYIYTRFNFWHYNPRWSPQTFINHRNFLESTDVISIWFDRTMPHTLHNAIYKVRLFCFYVYV